MIAVTSHCHVDASALYQLHSPGFVALSGLELENPVSADPDCCAQALIDASCEENDK